MEFQIDRSLEVLQRTPTVLQAMLGGVSDFWSKQNYGEATFSPFDVVGHLIHAERTNWMTRAKIILAAGETQAFGAFDRYAMYETSKGKTLAELLETFAAERSANLQELRKLNLSPEQLETRGRHPELGTAKLRELFAAWTVHDLGHLHQIAKAMAYQYREDVGPWRKYLTILPVV